MAAIHLLRSKTSLLYSSKFKLLRLSINSLTIHNQHDQSPNFLHHFRQIHSNSESSPKRWSTFTNPQSEPTISSNSGGNPQSEPTISSNSGGSYEEEGLANFTNTQIHSNSESSPKSWSIFTNPQSEPTISINSGGSNEEEGLVNPQIHSNSESSPKNWSIFTNPRSEPTISINSGGSNEEEGLANLSSKVGKSKVYWVCASCGQNTEQWWNTCKSCNAFGTCKKISVSQNEAFENKTKKSSWLPEQMLGQNMPVRLIDMNRGINHTEWRIRLPGLLGMEVNTLLGGGVVPGSLMLVGGDPGVGKSTLALQMAALIAVSCDVGGSAPVLYISGEESVEQVGNRADRLSIHTADLFLYSSTDIKDILEKVQLLSPSAVVVDSIQTVYLKEVSGSPGGVTQVKECTSALLRFAKRTNIPVLLIGHVNKSGEIAGPRVLEHIVDVVLYMEGEKHSSHRLLRSVKNRFGSTDELGVLKMSESGLEAVSNPSEMFLSEEHSDSEHLAGLAIAVIIDGSRSFLLEVQALCVSGPCVSRPVNGIQLSRADMIVAVLKKQAGLKLDDHSIFLNVVSGVSLVETSGDLAVAAAICSSFLEFPLPNHVAFIGEIGLGGELRMVPRIEKRVITLAKLGYKKCVVPESAVKALAAISSEIQIVGCKNLIEVMDNVFRRD